MPKPHHLAYVLRAERKRQGRTQQDVAEAAYTSQATIARWERGDRDPSLNGAIHWANALGMNLTPTRRSTSEEEV